MGQASYGTVAAHRSPQHGHSFWWQSFCLMWNRLYKKKKLWQLFPVSPGFWTIRFLFSGCRPLAGLRLHRPSRGLDLKKNFLFMFYSKTGNGHEQRAILFGGLLPLRRPPAQPPSNKGPSFSFLIESFYVMLVV